MKQGDLVYVVMDIRRLCLILDLGLVLEVDVDDDNVVVFGNKHQTPMVYSTGIRCCHKELSTCFSSFKQAETYQFTCDPENILAID